MKRSSQSAEASLEVRTVRFVMPQTYYPTITGDSSPS